MYKQMYLTLVDAVAKAIDLLTHALKKAEAIYISQEEPPILELPAKDVGEEAGKDALQDRDD